MRVIEIDGSRWQTVVDFVRALQAAIGAPEGHGSSPDAFVDSMVWGGMNSLAPPYEVCVVGSENAPKDVRDGIALVASVLSDARKWRRESRGDDMEVSLTVGSARSESR